MTYLKRLYAKILDTLHNRSKLFRLKISLIGIHMKKRIEIPSSHESVMIKTNSGLPILNNMINTNNWVSSGTHLA